MGGLRTRSESRTLRARWVTRSRRIPFRSYLPCHRVIGSDGGLHGYGGGLPMKAMLLKLEGAVLT